METATWSGKIRALSKANGNMERCKVKVFKRFQMAKFMMVTIAIINLTGQVNACTVTEKFKRENFVKENITARVAKPTLAYLDSRSYNRYKT